ncbi:MAG: NERD domain-containing protein [Clostridiales bacterium]|nr:NERD domain-containing protein [Clostridiales bacterium]
MPLGISNASLIAVTFAAIAVVALIIVASLLISEYNGSEYHAQTRAPFIAVLASRKRRSEYDVYEALKMLPGLKKFLFRLSMQTNFGTTEIGAVMIHETGIYVFETIGLGGRITGNPAQEKWISRRSIGTTSKFANPTVLGGFHTEYIKSLINQGGIPFWSYAVFAKRSKLQVDPGKTHECRSVSADTLLWAVRENARTGGRIVTPQEIDEFYEKLKPLTLNDKDKKKAVA